MLPDDQFKKLMEKLEEASDSIRFSTIMQLLVFLLTVLTIIICVCGCGAREKSKPLDEIERDGFAEEVVDMHKRGVIDLKQLAVLLNIGFEVDSVKSWIPVPDVEARIDFRTNPSWVSDL